MRSLKPLESRWLAVLLLVAVVAALVFMVARVERQQHEKYDAAIADRLDQIARYGRVAASRGDYEKAIATVKGLGGEKFYLKSSSPALAAADIQQIVQTLVEAHGMRQESVQIAPHKDEDGRRQITVNLRLRGKLSGLQHVLYSLETTQPYLFVDNLSIQSTVRMNYVPVPDVEPEVTAQFDLSGYAMVQKK